MLEQAGDRIDHIAIHRYTYPYDYDPFENYMAFAVNLNERLSAFEGLIRTVSLERGIKHFIGITVDEWFVTRIPANEIENHIDVNVDEWGVMHVTLAKKEGAPRRDWQRGINLEAALATALYLNTFIRHAYSVRMANFCAPMAMSLGLKERGSPVLLPTIFYPFELYSRTCGQLSLDVFWYGETFSGTYKDRSYNGIRTLDVTATLDKSKKQLVIYVINQSKEKAMETTISLTSGEFSGEVKVSVINGPDVKAENTEEKPNQVGIHETSLQVSGKSFIFTFAPHSVTALICAVN